MNKKTFNEILRIINNACNDVFYSGARDVKATVIECATRIYIAQMQEEA